MTPIEQLSVKIFADGADLAGMRDLCRDPMIRGFTTNPTLMWKAGLTDYSEFAKSLLERISDKPISFEVVADDEEDIGRQARVISTWGSNVYVKVPVTTSTGESLAPLVRELSEAGIKINVTAVMTPDQVDVIARALRDGAPSCVSVFAGRIADAGVEPLPIMSKSMEILASVAPGTELIWASPREVLNLVQADSVGCHIITMTHDLIAKLDLLGKDLDAYSLETVQMFRSAALSAGFRL